MTIDTLGGPVFGFVDEDAVRVRVQITAPPELNCTLNIDERQIVINTISISGTPHAVIYLPGLEHAAAETIQQMGAAIRHHPAFPDGINANFADVLDAHTLWQRTFERGVEGETLACGTGSVASSLVSALLRRVESPVRIRVRGGELSVTFQRQGDQFSEIYLGGGARFIAEGVLHPEAWSW
jgi:diaminopimelate epimerase